MGDLDIDPSGESITVVSSCDESCAESPFYGITGVDTVHEFIVVEIMRLKKKKDIVMHC